MRKLFIILFSLCLFGTVYPSPPYDLVKEIAAEIAKHNIYESELVGFAGTPSTQTMRLNQLIMIANDNQLFLLTKHTNAVVRLYALRAIVNRKLIVSEELKDQFNKDKSVVVTLTGCMGSKSSVDGISKIILIQNSQ
ncbi:MAG TPA: hypothetical protein VGP43_10195 [Chitinophagaceae bacterium]|nr:hypothetical protein [Chitinophagaceae bacterium]